MYIAVKNEADGGIREWLGGYTLFDFVEAYGADYFDLTHWEDLLALMDEEGYVELTEESLGYLISVTTGNPVWSETEEDVVYYLFYDYPEEVCQHTYVSEVTVEATCIESGVMTYTCSLCGDAYTEIIPAIGHSYQAVVTVPTCTESGYTTHTCANCGATYTSDHVDPLDHNYEAVTTAPTCTEQGCTTHTCANCGDSYTDSYTEATGHSWDEGVVTQEPTMEAEGEKTYTCTVCGETRTEVLPKREPVIYDIPEDDSVEIPENNCFEGGTTVFVEKVEDGEIYDKAAEALKDCAQVYTVFEFTATKDGASVQSNGKLTVNFSIPADYSTNVAVYYMDESGKLTKLEIRVDTERRAVTVGLEHFSTYILTDEDTVPSVLPGDANGDGKVNARDARLLLRFIAGLTEEGEVNEAALDFNGDGRVNARDARAILQYIAGLTN